MGSCAWEMSLGIFRFETVVCEPSLENFRVDISLGNCCLGRSFALEHSFRNSRFESFVWELSSEICRLIYSTWDVSLGNVRLGSSTWDLSRGNFRLGSSA